MEYMSRTEKLNIIAICGFAAWLNTYIPYVKDANIRKWLKTAQTFLNKAWNERVKNLPYEQGMSLIKLAGQYEMEFRPQMKSASQIDINDVFALAQCAQRSKCITCEDPNSECELRELLQSLGIKGTSRTGCPYDIFSFNEEDDTV